MVNYRKKHCKICGSLFKPINPNQRYCSDKCKEEGTKQLARIRDRRRNRKKYGYKEYHRKCEACGKEFTTYYSKKRYCGSEECEKERICRKNQKIYKRLGKEYSRIKYRKYYENNKELCRLRKAIKYREIHNIDKEYIPKGFHKHTIDFVREYVEQFGYKLLSNEYVNNDTPIKLLCPEGHEWETTFHRFKDASARCFRCYVSNNYTSKPEQKVLDYFKEHYPNLELVHCDRRQIAPKELDLYFPEYRIAVEICGLYWHSEISGNTPKSYHYDKLMECYKKGIRLITVFEDEINNKFDIVMSRILTALNLIDKKYYASQCNIKEITNEEANEFYKLYHIQGSTQAIKSWGLFYSNQLLQAVSIGKVIRKHTSSDGVIELKRFCTKNYVTVASGFSKLFKVIKEYCKLNNLSTIKSYCDMRYSNIFNPIYEVVGFNLIDYTKYTPHYIKNGKRFRNISLRKTAEERKPGLTEFKLRLRQGYDRIWDCGHRTYVYSIED